MAESHVTHLKQESQVRSLLLYEEKFDSPAIAVERKRMAKAFLAGVPAEQIDDFVPNFFESMAMLFHRGYLDREMLWISFGHYMPKWWAACKDYIRADRDTHHDPTLFRGFEKMVDEFYKDEVAATGESRAELEPSQEDIKTFLTQESTRGE
jgi:hypothetical protein